MTETMRIKQLNYLVVLITIFVSGSLYYSSFLKNILLIPLLCLLIQYFVSRRIINNKNNLYINRNKLITIFLTILLTFSDLNAVSSSLLVLSTCMVSALLITEIISFNDFSDAFIKIILFLSVGSWLYLPVLLFQIQSPLPDFISIVDTPYSNFIIFGIYNARIEALDGLYYVNRNSGLFWEPGAFQIFVNTAFYLGIVRNELSRKRFLIFLVSILSINSSTGMLVFGLLCVVYFYRTKNNRTRRKNLSIMASATILIAIFVSTQLFKTTVEKFQDGTSNNASFMSRSTDYLVDTTIIKEHPLRGIGYGNLAAREKYSIDMMGSILYETAAKPQGADGLLLFLGYVGLLGIVVVWRLIYPSQIRNWSRLEKGLVLVAMVMMYNNENMLMYLFPWVMLFYGFDIHAKSSEVKIGCEQKSTVAKIAKIGNI